MKKSTIYEIAIRIIGIYSLTLVVYQAVAAIGSGIDLIKTTGDWSGGSIGLMLAAFVELIVASIIPWFLLFRTQRIINWICTPEDFEESVSFFAEPKVIYEIAIMVAGILLVIWSLPDFIFRLISYLNVRTVMEPTYTGLAFLQTYAVKVIIGAIAVAYANPIAAYFARRTKNIPRD